MTQPFMQWKEREVGDCNVWYTLLVLGKEYLQFMATADSVHGLTIIRYNRDNNGWACLRVFDEDNPGVIVPVDKAKAFMEELAMDNLRRRK